MVQRKILRSPQPTFFLKLGINSIILSTRYPIDPTIISVVPNISTVGFEENIRIKTTTTTPKIAAIASMGIGDFDI
jgi:hypothetical protein